MSFAERLVKKESSDRVTAVREHVQARLVEDLGPRLYDSTISEDELKQLVNQKLLDLLRGEMVQLSAHEKVLVSRQITDMVMGLGPLEEFLHDDTVTEVMVNGPDR